MKTYQRIPGAEISAIQFTGANHSEIQKSCPDARFFNDGKLGPFFLIPVIVGPFSGPPTYNPTFLGVDHWLIWQQNNTYEVMNDFDFRIRYEQTK